MGSAACKSGTVPSACSDQSKAIAGIPHFCPANMYAGPLGFDSNACPSTNGTWGGPDGGSSGFFFKPDSSNQCVSYVLNAAACSPQGAYMITNLSPLFCPQ